MLPARFHLPGLRYNYPLNMFWVSLLEEHPEYFREGVEIGSFFGVFPMALWNGGRLTPAYDQCDKAFVEGVIKAVNDKGIPVRYTFTNPLLNEHDCEDPYCNYLMQAADNGMNEVMIFSPILEKYLREKYPNFAYNSSTCKEIKDVDEINREMERDYKYVVLDYNFNNKWDILDKIEHKDKLEVLVNTLCEPGCKRRGEHYRQIAKDQKTMLLNRTLPADKQIPIKHWHCDYGEYNCVHTIQDYPTFISPEDIWEKYIPAGINNFKIEGRTGNLFSLIDTYCFFMLKPEKAGEARLLLLRNLEKAHVITVSRPRPGQWP
ncbi:hypothetical protein SAMN02910339_00269 [Lachnospiraceae bacterium YSD2013]|nr:hypothetical protein [Lachnospiraceae bacterium]SCX01020.1 hypothetical protein SAMN02910339_00269 [Lachnospiraceae bacterium YSD2013]